MLLDADDEQYVDRLDRVIRCGHADSAAARGEHELLWMIDRHPPAVGQVKVEGPEGQSTMSLANLFCGHVPNSKSTRRAMQRPSHQDETIAAGEQAEDGDTPGRSLPVGRGFFRGLDDRRLSQVVNDPTFGEHDVKFCPCDQRRCRKSLHAAACLEMPVAILQQLGY